MNRTSASTVTLAAVVIAGVTLALGHGPQHLENCLEALALYEVPR